MPDPLFSPEVRLMLEEQDADGLRAFCQDLHPATMADVLDSFPPEQIWDVLSHADIRKQAGIFEYLPPHLQLDMLAVDRPQVGEVIGKMSHDDRVDLMRRAPGAVRERLLRVVDEAERKDIATLVEYGVNTVGAIMTTDYAWLPPGLNVQDAIEQLRQQAPDRETIYYIYVLDDLVKRENGKWSRKLLGAISLRDLILAPKGKLIRDLMSDEIVSLKYEDPAEKAGQILARYDFIAVPVIDEDGGMLGIVTHDDVIDIIQEEATEDLQRQGGVSPLGESYMEASFFKIWRSRAFWLSLLFLAELMTFTVMRFFEDAISAVVVLSLFVPLCISTGGNSGSQASTLITRALALGEITLADWKRLLRRELLMGLALGLTLGVIAFFRGAMTGDDTRGGPHTEAEPFRVTVGEATVSVNESKDYVFPTKSIVSRSLDRPQKVRLPEGTAPPEPRTDANGLTYDFPAGCEVRTEAVSRWKLGQVIAISVLGICLWGTLIGSILPLVFKKFNRDPAIASGPFVATFVDVTGIFIFFSVASWLLL